MEPPRGPLVERLAVSPWLPGLACFAGLLLALLAFRDFPLLGSLVGAVLSGAVAGLLAEAPRDAARAGFAAGAAAVAALVVLALAGPVVFLGSPLLAVSTPVLLAEAAVLGLVPALAAGVGARALQAWRPAPGEPPAARP